MPKLQRFEGENAEQVRARVLVEVGPDAEIVHAGRERTGGVLGFFEKERFVLEVSVPDGATAAAPAPGRLRTVETVAEETDDIVDIAPNRFAETFSNVLEEAEAALADASDPTIETDSLAPDFSPPAAVGPRPGWRMPPDKSAALHLGELSTANSAEAPRIERPRGLTRLVPMAGGRAKGSKTATLARTSPDVTGLSDTDLDELARRLEDLGVPAISSAACGGRLDLLLLDAFQTLPSAPEPPAALAGVGLVALGRGPGALRLAKLFAARMGAPESAVLAVSLTGKATRAVGVLSGPLAAAQALAARRVNGEVTLLGVDLGTADLQFRLVRQLIAGARPESVWAAFPANTDVEELADALSSAGGIDALALYDLDEAPAPAVLAQVGLPVAYLDWREATPLMWSARVFERLTEALHG